MIADLNAAALMLNGFLSGPTGTPGRSGPGRWSACPAGPPGWSGVRWRRRWRRGGRGPRSGWWTSRWRRRRAAGVDLASGAGAFVVDLGGGTTEIAVVSGGRVVRAQSLRVAGNAMDDAIMHLARTDRG